MAIWGQRLEWCSHSWWMPGATEAGKARYDLTLEASGAWSPCHHLAVRRLVTRTQEKEPEKRRPWTPRGDILNIVKQLIFGQRNWKPDLCSQWKQRSFLLACLFGFIFNFNMSYIYIFFFLIGGSVFCNVVLISAIQQCESAVIIHMARLSRASLPPPPSHTSRSYKHQVLSSLCYTATVLRLLS